jgi:hypothetical protein
LPARLLLFFLFFVSAGCAAQGPAKDPVDPALLRQVKARLTALRGLDFKADVPIETRGQAAMLRYFEQDLKEDYGEDGLALKALAYGKLGLIPPKVDLKKALLDFYDAQVVAFYDPKKKKLVMPESLAEIIAARGGESGENVLILAHELTHALQDQHFPVVGKMAPGSDDDGDLALGAVIEGDATLSSYAYMGLGPAALAEMGRSIQNNLKETRAALPNVPEAIIEEMLFRYYGGVAFLLRLLEGRDWRAVDALYSAPPLSTEQVIHPEKYLTFPDPPTKIALNNLAALFPPGWRQIENNVMGELMVRVLFARFLGEAEAKVVSEGWDGDRFVAFSRGDEVAFVWASVWDSEGDADEFSRGYRRLVEKKYSDARAVAAVMIERRGRQAIVVEGLPRDRAAEGIEKIWQGMKAAKVPFKSPFPPPSGALPIETQSITP